MPRRVLMERELEIFAALSDRTRLRIYRLLGAVKKEAAVCEIIDSLEESQYNVSKHLRILKNASLIRESKSGRWVFYSVNSEAGINLTPVMEGIKDVCFDEDLIRMKKRLGLRKDGEIVSCSIASELMGAKSGKEKNS
jgi:ArsR family transcriptional regulator, arsenate/arsenite/antimonite-responsive transcriptional repressor